jgi:hypothetical protein
MKSTTKLLYDIFGYDDESVIKYDFLPEAQDNLGDLLLIDVIHQSFSKLTAREGYILELRYGISKDCHCHTLEQISNELSCTRERIRQIQAKAFRKLRHPSRSKYLKPFLPTNKEMRIGIARTELFNKLKAIYREDLALIVASRIKEPDLRAAFISTENALKISCGQLLSQCLSCGKPLPPNWTFCDRKCKSQYNHIVLICDGCGNPFVRKKNEMIYKIKDKLKVSNKVFCCRACYHQKNYSGEICSTCGRTKPILHKEKVLIKEEKNNG